MTRRRVGRLLMVGLLLSPRPAPAWQSTADGGELEKGIRLVREGDFTAAVVALDGAVRRLSATKQWPRDLARAHTYLAVAHLGLDQRARARADLREAWQADPTLTLSPIEFAQGVIALFQEVKGRDVTRDASATKRGRGSSKLPLVLLGGAAVVGGGVALATRSEDTSTPAPAPRTLGMFGVNWGGSGVTCNGYTANFFDVPGPGTLRVTARWTPATYNFDLFVNTRPAHQLVASNTSPVDNGTTSVETPVSAQQYDYELRYVSGCPERATGSVEVVFTPLR